MWPRQRSVDILLGQCVARCLCVCARVCIVHVCVWVYMCICVYVSMCVCTCIIYQMVKHVAQGMGRGRKRMGKKGGGTDIENEEKGSREEKGRSRREGSC